MEQFKKTLDRIISNNVLFIILLIAAFEIFWPLGVLLILYKAGVIPKKSAPRNVSKPMYQETRFEKYMVMTEGKDVESISYLASAVGVNYNIALSDIQKMVAEGYFGSQAYINYFDKTIVIKPEEVRKAKSEDEARSRRESAESANSNTSKSTATVNENGAKNDDTRKSSATHIDKKKKSGDKTGSGDRGLSTGLLIAGIALIIFGFFACLDSIEWIIDFGFDSYMLEEFLPGAFMMSGGVISLVYRGFIKKRANRLKIYEAAIINRDELDISELASMAGVSEKKVVKDIEYMLEKSMLPKTAYIDHGEGKLIINKIYHAPEAAADEAPKDDEARYKAILKEIRDLNDAIPDPDVSERIYEIEDLTSKIFRAVQDKPEKLPQIKSFMSYYLPTTLKLLHSYAMFDGSGLDGNNVKNAKAEIERILDTLTDGFRKQLDKLYEADAIDIASDINVLENMLRRDGLTDDENPFGAAALGLDKDKRM